MWWELELPWKIAFDQGWESYRSGSIPIGAVIVDKNGEIVSVGRNRTMEDESQQDNVLSGNPLAHAEMNALLGLDYDVVDPYSCVIYSTVEPCPLCVGAICVGRIRAIRYASEDSHAGSIELLYGNQYLAEKNFKIEGPFDRVFETIIHALQVEYFLQLERFSLERVFQSWEKTNPTAVKVGRLLSETGEIRALAKEGALSENALELIYKRVLDVQE